MKQVNSYIKDTGDFPKKLRAIGEIANGVIIVIRDVVGLYNSIPHKFIDKTFSTEDIIKMFYKQISGTAKTQFVQSIMLSLF